MPTGTSDMQVLLEQGDASEASSSGQEGGRPLLEDASFVAIPKSWVKNELGPWNQTGLCLDLDRFVQWQSGSSFSFRGLSVKCVYLSSPGTAELGWC